MKLVDYIKEKENKTEKAGLEKEAIKKLLIEGVYHSYTNLIMNYNNEIDSHYFNIMENLTNEYIEKKKPIQYILGYSYFCGLKLKVNNNVLIPRPETELLVERAILEIKKHNYKKAIDLGTGSGAIAITVKKATGIDMTAVDVSKEALSVALENSSIYELSINFIQGDMFDAIKTKYDVILSNPPYISSDDINNIDKIVYDNEPHLALFGDDNGLYYYKKMIDGIDRYLTDDGVVIMEIGEKEAKQVGLYLDCHKPNYQMEVLKDYNNLDRVIVIRKK